MSDSKITIDFRFDKKTGRHRLTIQYHSEPGTPMYLHNRQHSEILEQVAAILKKQGLDIGDFEVVIEPRQEKPLPEKKTEPSPVIETGDPIYS